MTNCRNCNHQIEENYCPKCGQTAKLKRIDGQYLIHEIQHVFHFENGFLYTIRELLTRPGESVRIYIAENRSLLVKPLIFIIITSLIYTLTTKLFQIEDGYVIYDETEKSITGIIFNLVQHHYGYANIIMGVFTALWARIFFYKVDYNFYEILILLCFAMGIGMLIYSVFAIFQGLTNFDLMRIAGFLAMAYCTWAIGQFFDKKKTINYVKAFVSYALGMFSFFLSTLFVGALIELITN